MILSTLFVLFMLFIVMQVLLIWNLHSPQQLFQKATSTVPPAALAA